MISDAGTIVALSDNGGLVFGVVSAEQSIDFTGRSIVANEIAVVGQSGSGALTLASQGAVQVDALAAAGIISIRGGHLSLGSVFGGGQSLTLEATGGAANLGNIRSAGIFTLTAVGDIVVSQSLASKGDVNVTGGGLVSLQQVFSVADLEAQSLVANGNISITARGDLTTGSAIFGQNVNLSSTTGSLTIDANIIAAASLELVAARDIGASTDNPTDANAIFLQAGGLMSVTAGGQISFNILSAGGDLAVVAGTSLRGQTIISGEDIDLRSTASAIEIDAVQAGHALVIKAGSLALGNLFADGGSITLEANNGGMTLANAQAPGRIKLDATGDIVVSQNIVSKGDISVTGGALVSLQQVFSVADLEAQNLVANGNITIIAHHDLEAGATFFGKAINLVSTTGSMRLNRVNAAQALDLLASNGAIAAGDLFSGEGIAIEASGPVNLNTLIAQGVVMINSRTAGIAAGVKIVSGGNLTLVGQGEITTPQTISGGHISITTTGSMRVDQSVSVGTTQFTANGLIRSDIITALLDVTVAAGAGAIEIDHIISDQNITLTAAGIIQGKNSGAIWEALLNLSVSSDGDLVVDQALAGQNIILTSNTGNMRANELGAGNVVTLEADNTITLDGQIVAGNGIAITATHGAINSQSDIITRGNIVLNAGNAISFAGDLIGLGEIYAKSGGNLEARNTRTGRSLTLLATHLNITENLSAVENIDVTAAGNIQIGQSVVAGGDHLRFSADGGISYGLLSAQNNAYLQSGTSTISLAAPTYVEHDLTIIAQTANLDLVPLQASLRTGGTLNIQSANINMAGGQYAFGGIHFIVSGGINLVGTQLYAARNEGGSGNIVIEAQSLAHDTTSKLVAEGDLALSMPSFANDFQLAALGNLYLNINGDLTNNGVLYGASNMTINQAVLKRLVIW